MINYFKRLAYVLGEDTRKIPLLLLVFIISSIADVLSVAIVGPYTKVVTDPQTMADSQFLNKIFLFLHISEYNPKIVF